MNVVVARHKPVEQTMYMCNILYIPYLRNETVDKVPTSSHKVVRCMAERSNISIY